MGTEFTPVHLFRWLTVDYSPLPTLRQNGRAVFLSCRSVLFAIVEIDIEIRYE